MQVIYGIVTNILNLYIIRIPEGKENATQVYMPLCDPMDYSRQASLSMEFSRQGYWNEFCSLLHRISPAETELESPGRESLSCRQVFTV